MEDVDCHSAEMVFPFISRQVRNMTRHILVSVSSELDVTLF